VAKQNLAFLIAGLGFGFLLGFGLFQAIDSEPDLQATMSAAGTPRGPAGPAAPTQVAPKTAAAGAPMMAEIRALKKRVQADPADQDAFEGLARLYHDGAMWDQAIEYYKGAIELSPTDPDLLTDMGSCFRAKRDFDRALELFRRANDADPAHWQSLFNTVVVAGFDLGRFEQAAEALETMERMDPPPPRLEDLRRELEAAIAGAGPIEGEG
jgi:tetratricopeptide (TPR) repeat protein